MKTPAIDPFRLAEALIAHGHFREALGNVEVAIKHGDTRPSTLLTLALCQIEIGEHEKALEALRIVQDHIDLLPANVAGPLKRAHAAVEMRMLPVAWDPMRLEPMQSIATAATAASSAHSPR